MLARVLVIDDDPALLRSHERLLSHWDWSPVTASTAHDALAKARTLRPDLILTDLVMPHANGLDLLHWLRDDPALCDIPVIAMSEGVPDRNNPVLRDFDDVLAKPVSGLQLTGAIDRVLRERSAWHTEHSAEP